MDPGNLEGLIPIFGGVWGLLLARGVIPVNPKDPAKLGYGVGSSALTTWICPVLIVFGVAQLFGVM